MKQFKTNSDRKNFIIFITITAVLVILSGLLGYHLAKRYKETITDTYYNVAESISGKINDFQSDVLDEMSKLENEK